MSRQAEDQVNITEDIADCRKHAVNFVRTPSQILPSQGQETLPALRRVAAHRVVDPRLGFITGQQDRRDRLAGPTTTSPHTCGLPCPEWSAELTKLFYAGPPLRVLHEEYAKKGRIDQQAPVATTYEVSIQAPRERVWQLLADPPDWQKFAPAIHDVHLNGPVASDTDFTWANGRARMKSRFAIVDPGRELTWTGASMG